VASSRVSRSSTATVLVNSSGSTVNNGNVMRLHVARASVMRRVETVAVQATVAGVVAVRNVDVVSAIPNLLITLVCIATLIATSRSTSEQNSSRTECCKNLLHVSISLIPWLD